MKYKNSSLLGVGVCFTFLVMFIAQGIFAQEAPAGRSFLIDFGAADRKSPEQIDTVKGELSVWNNLTGGKLGDGIKNLKDENGNASSINLVVTDSFWQENSTPWNEKGTKLSTIYPPSATSDSFFIGTLYGHTEETAGLRFEGLTKGAVYTVRIYASRMTEDLQSDRTTLYTINGVTKALQVRNNIDNYVEFSGVTSKTQTIDIGLSMAENAIFGYVGVIELIENLPPTVSITQPLPILSSSGSNSVDYIAPANITISADASDKDGKVAQVKFYANNTLLAEVTTSPYTYVWANVPVGTYSLKAVAVDDTGLKSTSKSVKVTVKPKPNVPPTASAGPNQKITLPKNTVTLSGSGYDSDGTIQSYSWTQTSGPSVAIQNASSPTASVSGIAVAGVYGFTLEVTDNSGAKANASTTVTVEQAPNVLPTANAGSDQTIKLPTSQVSLKGSGADSDGTIVAYHWTGSGGSIVTPNASTTLVTGLTAGSYAYTLEVTDDRGGKATSTVHVKVDLADNILPTANAGSDLKIKLPTNSVTLKGSGSDTDGAIVSYKWTGAGGTIANPNSATTQVTGLSAGSYSYTLEVTDNRGGKATDSVTVVVDLADNVLPTANAGASQSIKLPTNSVTLNGSGSDSDGSIVSYKWAGTGGTIVTPNAATTKVTGLTAGNYSFTLEVTDNRGGKATSSTSVSVALADNVPPTAKAGQNITIKLPVNSVTLNGSGTDTDGTIVGYHWTGNGGTIVSPNAASTVVKDLKAGNYSYTLEVTDDRGGKSTSSVTVTVNLADNVLPSANAGADLSIKLPTNSVTLKGSGSDSDGKIVSYQWTGNGGTIVSPGSASTQVTGLTAGTYTFTLQVTDDRGGKASDAVTVKVDLADNVLPTANAGADQKIKLPTNSVTLKGSGTDSDGTIVGYKWTGTGGVIVSPTSASTQVIGLSAGSYTYTLEVTDNRGGKATDSLNVVVDLADNILPTANAGANQTIKLPVNFVVLNGSGSDKDGKIVAYKWTGSGGVIANPASASTQVNGLTAGSYTYTLEVTDDRGGKASSSITVKVDLADNILPTANAGLDVTIKLPNSSASLTGSGSDKDGRIVSYVWTGNQGKITNPTSAATTVTGFTKAGSFTYILQVTDDRGGKASDTVVVNVLAANVPPTVKAGADQTITLPATTGATSTATLAGSATDTDGTIAGYSWTQVSGSKATITDANKATAKVSGLVAGTYVFKLEVVDNEGAKASDQVQLTVKSAPTGKLTVNAGSNKSYNQPANYPSMSSSLAGSVTIPKGATITSYSWTQISGPTATIQSPHSAKTAVTGLTEGTATFEFEVHDNQGRVGTDRVSIYVHREPNVRAYTTGYNIKRTDGYIEYLPDGYSTKASWPLIIFLHGVGEMTDRDSNGKSTNLLDCANGGPLHYTRTKDENGNYHKLPFIVLNPQSSTWWSAADLEQFRKDAIKKYHVDQTRVYITGLSMGGYGVNQYLTTQNTGVDAAGKKITEDYSKYIAAAITFAPASSINLATAQKLVANNVALWNFHSLDDGVCKPLKTTFYTFSYLSKALGGNTEFNFPAMDPNAPTYAKTASFDGSKFVWANGDQVNASGPQYYCTAWNEGGHGHWERVYCNPDTYAWLLQHHK